MLNLAKLNICKPCQFTCYSCQTLRSLSSSQLKEYYELLNVTRTSTSREIKDSFLRLSKIYHPDNKDTGSHAKFVALKQAYDAIKDGPPTTSYQQPYPQPPPRRPTSTSTTYTRSSFEEELKNRAYRQNQDYSEFNRSRFGGPFRDSSTPWEDLSREREWSRSRYSNNYGNRYQRGRSFISITVSLSVLAWIAIYTCILLSIDFDSHTKRRAERLRRENAESEYEVYKRLVKERKDTVRYLKEKRSDDPYYLGNLQEEEPEPELDLSDLQPPNELRLEPNL